jgi:HSP20 family molecular chaperone IbpA
MNHNVTSYIGWDYPNWHYYLWDWYGGIDWAKTINDGSSELKPLPKYHLSPDGLAYMLEVDLPGYTKNEIVVEHKSDCVVIDANSAMRGKYHYCQYLVALKDHNYDMNKFSAKYTNGVLTVTLPIIPLELLDSSRRIPIND